MAPAGGFAQGRKKSMEDVFISLFFPAQRIVYKVAGGQMMFREKKLFLTGFLFFAVVACAYADDNRSRIDTLQSRVDTLQSRVDQLDSRQADTRIRSNDFQIESLEDRIDDLESDQRSTESRIRALETKINGMASLEQRFRALEREAEGKGPQSASPAKKNPA